MKASVKYENPVVYVLEVDSESPILAGSVVDPDVVGMEIESVGHAIGKEYDFSSEDSGFNHEWNVE